MKKILTLVGTRPNFIKITQLEKEFARFPKEFEYKLCHTGQHYDVKMSDVFFSQLKIRQPDFYLGGEGQTAAAQIGSIIFKLSQVLEDWKPDLLMVVGDVNSTLAGAVAAEKSGIPIAHIESGLRSRDRSMPEEINRILTDEITRFFFVTEESGRQNLIAEGKSINDIHMVGNTMIDTLVAFSNEIEQQNILQELGLKEKNYFLMTIHRPATVDHEEPLRKLIEIIRNITLKRPVVFPVHPRTESRLKSFGLEDEFKQIENLIIAPPLDYFSFQKLIAASTGVITDSGGIQEETTFRKVPCLTLRPNTERPVTIELGTNILLPLEVQLILSKVNEILEGQFKTGEIPPLWDGRASQRIVEKLREVL